MKRALSAITGVVGSLSWTLLFRLLFLALLALVLYGSLPDGGLAWLLLLFVLGRGAWLARESMRKVPTEATWEQLYFSLSNRMAQSDSDELAQAAREHGLDPASSAADVARAAVESMRLDYVAPRARPELACETLGLIAFALLIPADTFVYTSDFVSLRRSHGWVGIGVASICVCLYAWPFLWAPSMQRVKRRMLWWGVPFLPALVLFAWGITERHPYLDPFRPDRARLAAERVLALESNIPAGAHASWVFDYARILEEQGDTERAIYFYREGLRLDPYHPEERVRLAALEHTNRDIGDDAAPRPADPESERERAHLPLLEAGYEAAPLPRCEIDSSLGQLDRTAIVMVRIGDVEDWLLDTIGYVIERELGLSSCVASLKVPLPSHTRMRGLLLGRQWSLRSLVTTFLHRAQPLPTTPAKYLLVSPADLYDETSNYMFAVSYSWGALVSFARFGDPADDPLLLAHRTAKQTLGSLVKSFGVPVSPDPNCVTSYPRNLEEFDSKGNRPNAESFELFQRALRKRDGAWAEYRARS